MRGQIEIIRADPALRFLGAMLALTHVLTFVWWLSTDVAALLADSTDPVCWPFFESCWDVRFANASTASLLLYAYGAAGAAGVVLFAKPRSTTAAWFMLAALTLWKLAIIALDFRLRLNQHLMSFAATIPFLFLPDKKSAHLYLVVAFYFFAGTLKLNEEWLSGAALGLSPSPLVRAACAYAVALELVLVFGLFFEKTYFITLAQLVAFHLASWPFTGFFYPLIMFALLAPLRRAPRSRSAVITIAVFAALQVVPWLIPGDSRITGEGRLFALHMYDARVECEAWVMLESRDGRERRIDLPMEPAARIRCDPLVHRQRALALCRRMKSESAAYSDLSLHLRSRLTTESELTTVVDRPRFCSDPPIYRLFGKNDWINPDRAKPSSP